MHIYFPVKTSIKSCYLFESNANELIEKQGGSLVLVPAFESKENAEQWIQNQDNPNDWRVTHFDNSILLDNEGNLLTVQTTKRKPFAPIPRIEKLKKPDFIYCVEPA